MIEFLVKILLVVLFLPVLLCLAFQAFVAVAVAVLPWLIGCALIAGLTAGLSAGLVLRRRLPPRSPREGLPGGTPPLGGYRARRTRGGRW